MHDDQDAPAGLALAWAGAADLAAVRACLDEVVAPMDGAATFALRWGQWAARAAAGGRLLCAWAPDGSAAGFGCLFDVDPATPQGQVFATVGGAGALVEAGGLVVREAWRGRGVARQLLSARLGRAGELGYDQVLASVAPSVAASRANLDHHGFTVLARTRLYGADRLVYGRRP